MFRVGEIVIYYSNIHHQSKEMCVIFSGDQFVICEDAIESSARFLTQTLFSSDGTQLSGEGYIKHRR